MPFPRNIEGTVVVEIDAPSKSQRVADGVEKWLLGKDARDLKWAQDRLCFSGNPAYIHPIRRRMKNPKAKLWPGLVGIGNSAIQFHNHPEKVVMNYTISFSFSQMWLVTPLLLAVVAAITIYSLVLGLVAVAGLTLLYFATWLAARYGFQSDIRIAAIRGLADGAAHELTDLQSK